MMLVVLMSLVASAKASDDGQWSTVRVQDRDSRVFVPDCAAKGSPLIVALHAWGSDHTMQEAVDHHFAHYGNVGPECAVVVYPEGKLRVGNGKWALPFGGFSWNAGGCCPDDNIKEIDDVAYIGNVISQLAFQFDAVSEDLVFVVGVSNGGMMANRLACTDTRIKAMVSVAGPLVNGTGVLQSFPCSRQVPVLHFHGDDDPIVPFDGCNATFGSSTCRGLLASLGDAIATSFPSVPDYIHEWRMRNGQAPDAPSAITFQNGTTQCTSSGSAASNVTLCVVAGQGHAWPGSCVLSNKLVPGTACSDSIDASYHALAFIRQYMHLPSATVVV